MQEENTQIIQTIPVSILDWWIAVGIDYSDRWAEIIQITEEEYGKIRSWLAIFDVSKKEVVDVEQVIPPEPTFEEIQELRANEPVNIIIPMTVWDSEVYHPMVKGQIENLRNNRYSEIKFRPINDDEDMEVYNILYKDIPKFMTVEWYQWYKQLGIQFHDYVEEYFRN